MQCMFRSCVSWIPLHNDGFQKPLQKGKKEIGLSLEGPALHTGKLIFYVLTEETIFLYVRWSQRLFFLCALKKKIFFFRVKGENSILLMQKLFDIRKL